MIPLAVKYTINKPKILKAATWRQILKQSWFETARYWFRNILPKHFTRSGAQEYRYQPRTAAYMRRKARKGHQDPLVFTGRLKRTAMNVRDIRHTAKGATVHLRGLPTYVIQRRWGTASPFMAAELTKLSKNDRDRLVQVMDKRLQQNIDKQQQSGRFTRR